MVSVLQKVLPPFWHVTGGEFLSGIQCAGVLSSYYPGSRAGIINACYF